ncbi:MAG: 1-deoxy-D-xylulose-5-phosphate synthase [Candidatus Hydrogenedentota bacterium]|nr:MAG: 1-deoxy-D-xylulose-5-phosphate synthase [Candidatus Hydrogenedentota bacterium]
MKLLKRIESPADLKALSIEELKELAAEIRRYIIEVTSVRGGHLGAPLGAVELTLAVHKVFDAPRDKIIFDVGHQGYAHKIITGRRDVFPTLRSYKGIAGFLKRSESEYDCYGAGHASTSISAAVGFAQARDLRGSDEKVVAIIGDGAMTGGLAYEGLNNAGDLGTDILVILNDNMMSIAENVGAVSNFLNRLLTAPLYHRAKDDIEDLLNHLNEKALIDKRFPTIAKLGNQILDKAHKLKESLKHMVLPNILFEELGFTYYGPIPGHDLSVLIPMLEQIKKMRGPILLHTITQKGKGVEWAETHPEKYHGAKPGYNPETGEVVKKGSGGSVPTWTAVFSEELIAMARENKDIVALTAAMPSGTGLDKFRKVFPERCFDVGIAEGHAVVAAAGMAAAGLRPVVAVYSTFLQRAFDMIIHDVAIQNLPVFFAMDRGGIVGDDGETHQGVFDMAYMRMIPNMTVMVPKDDAELRAMMRLGLSLPGPASVRYPRGSAFGITKLTSPVRRGRAERLREGRDAVILAFGPAALEALEIAEELEESEKLSVGVVNMRFVKPLDLPLLLELAREVPRMVTIEEGVLAGGAGSAVAEALADAGAKVVLRRIGVPDRFVEHGVPELVKNDLGMGKEDIRRAVLEVVRAAAPLSV